MPSQLLLVGIAAGLGAAFGIALIFSSVATQSTAQTMHNQGMDMTGNQGMMMVNKATFSAHGGSMVDGVQITGISVAGENEISVNLRYTGTGEAPNLTIVATTNPMGMMNRMHGSGMVGGNIMGTASADMTQGMMPSQSMPMTGQMPALTNSTEWHHQQQQSMMATQAEVGSTILDAGWEASATTANVKIGDENSSAYDSSGIMVMVFPRS